MRSRALVLLALGAVAALSLLPGPAEPGGATTQPQMQQQKVQPEKLQQQKLPQQKEISRSLSSAEADLKNAVSLMGKTRANMTAALKKQQAQTNSAKEQVAAALKLAQEPGGADAKKLEAIRKSLEGAMKSLEAQDKLGNFEIQDLMSRYNQAETLASNVQKKLNDTNNSVIGKI